MAQVPRAPQPLYLEQDEAEQEEEHVDDLVDDEAASEGHHDEHHTADTDPELGKEIPHHVPQLLQHVPHLAGVCGARRGCRSWVGALGSAPHTCGVLSVGDTRSPHLYPQQTSPAAAWPGPSSLAPAP